MADAIIIYPNSREEASLYRQLAKRLNNKFVAKADKTPAKEKKWLDDLSESIREMRQHEEGKITLESAKDILDEL